MNSLPEYLQPFVVDSFYEKYTAQNHAAWRYIMRQNEFFLGRHAHISYLEGLRKTGIGINKIPHIDEINNCLKDLGWRAVLVNGFIPPAIFMEFQANKVMPISQDIRTMKHILYTPAPDIVHEAAGHAPIVVDQDYGHFLQKVGEYGSMALSTKEDGEVYNAIRNLSIIKEYPHATAEEIQQAENTLAQKHENNHFVSEATKISRFHWWTVEYGLVGTPTNFSLYGAGLLSSVGESKNCLSPKVKKIPLSLDCINCDYNITKEQPQLFVARDWNHLLEVLEQLADTMSFRIGGAKAIKNAINTQNIATVQYDSGLQVSGIISNLELDSAGGVKYISTQGPTTLNYQNLQLKDHGEDYHAQGFGSPVGKIRNLSTPLYLANEDQLREFGINLNTIVELNFESGIHVKGFLFNILRKEEKNILFSFKDCLVKDQQGQTLFDPSWGNYDMAIGETVPKVFAGPADRNSYNIKPHKSDLDSIQINYSKQELSLFQLYNKIRQMRESQNCDYEELTAIVLELDNTYSSEWCIYLEIIELLNENGEEKLKIRVREHLEKLKNKNHDYDRLISDGLALLD